MLLASPIPSGYSQNFWLSLILTLNLIVAKPLAKFGQALSQLTLGKPRTWISPRSIRRDPVLDAHYPTVSSFLFENLAADTGVAAVAGVQRFLDRLDSLRDGKATGVDPDQGRAAVELLAIRKIVDATKAAELRQLIETARLGAQPDEVIEATEMDPHRREVAKAYIQWLNEWREVARVSIARRDYRISLGLAQGRQPGDESDGQEPAPTTAATHA